MSSIFFHVPLPNQLVDFFEYAALHSFMDKLNAAFVNADADKNGALDINGMFQSLSACTFYANHQMIETTRAMQDGGFGIPPYCITRFFQQFQTNGVCYIPFDMLVFLYKLLL